MISKMKNATLINLFTLAALFSSDIFLAPVTSDIFGGQLLAAESRTEIKTETKTKTRKKTRKTPAMREKIYSQLAQAQKYADDGNIKESLVVIERLNRRSDLLNSYEKAMVWNFKGFILYGENDIKGALASFSHLVEQKNIPEALELSTLYSLAQLNMQVDEYQAALKYIDRWSKLKGSIDGKAYVLKANAYYAMKNFSSALKAISKALLSEEKAGKLPKENWLVLQRALFYELKQPVAVTAVSEKLVRFYPKPKYWVELANMYGETEQTRKQLAVMEAAYQQGYIEKSADFQALAQLYYFNGAPYKAAALMKEQLKAGKLNKDISNLRFLAQAWTRAKEVKKAVPVLKEAAEISRDGNIDARLAEALLNLGRWQEAITAGKIAQQKGDLESPGNVSVALGMANFNLKKYASALVHFNAAKKHPKVRKMASQWLGYVEREKHKQDKLFESMASIAG